MAQLERRTVAGLYILLWYVCTEEDLEEEVLCVAWKGSCLSVCLSGCLARVHRQLVCKSNGA